eukprot:CAMPEP_0176491406 /NCGR_PEP_ID=MMETSP0200_2-20121128/8412_1 /TAXON_ID=947934 /ORGANISM="Chaetoceros sp., Strain GSL56" /LENGTH=346 /DNA_ID=CAMNT_0017888827 /DNA_START=219 /DNA_END=1259 /DNA_ORIENTATION=+
MSESGNTEAQRRALRVQQRDLKALIADERSELSEQIADVSSGKFQDVRKMNNKLYEDVAYTREAVLDSENLELISSRAARQVDKLIEIPRYDVNKFIGKLRRKCMVNETQFNWKLFGYEVGSCFNCLPSHVSFLNGPVNAEYEPKQRKKPERRTKQSNDDVEEEEVGNVQQKKRSKDEDKLSAAEKQVSDIKKLLSEKSQSSAQNRISIYEETYGKEYETWSKDEHREFKKKERDVGEIPGIQFLFNPKSFTQTVENIFGLSFLVKKGDVKVGIRKPEDCTSEHSQPGFFIKDLHDTSTDKVRPAKQAIVSLSMADWKHMVESYNIQQSDIPHRGKSRYAKSPAKN